MINEDMREYWCWRCFGMANKEACKECQKKTFFAEFKEKYSKLDYKVGDKVKFWGEKRAWKIRACDERFIIATKPYNPKRTFLYTIIDFKYLVRGADNYGCLYNYDNEKEAKKALKQLSKQNKNLDCDLHISFRNYVKLTDIEIIKQKAGQNG